jgi:hypothetical protein
MQIHVSKNVKNVKGYSSGTKRTRRSWIITSKMALRIRTKRSRDQKAWLKTEGRSELRTGFLGIGKIRVKALIVAERALNERRERAVDFVREERTILRERSGGR